MKNKNLLLFVIPVLLLIFCFGAFAQDNSMTPSAGRAPYVNPQSVQYPMNLLAYNSRAFGYNAYGGSIAVGPFKMWLSTPFAMTSLFTDPLGATAFVQAASFANGFWYGVRYSTAAVVKIDTSTGVLTQVGTVTGIGAGSITGIAWDATTNTMYALNYVSGATKVGTLNLSTYAWTGLAGSQTTGLPIDMAISNAGNIYVNVITAPTTPTQLYQVDKVTGAFTALPSNTGYNGNYAQGMSWDHSVDTGYLAAYNYTTSAGELRKINIATGATTLVGTLTSEVDGFMIPGGPAAPPPAVNRSLLLPTPGVNTNYVSVPYNANQNFGNTITIEAWVKLGSVTTANTILNKGGASFDYQLGIIGTTATPFFRGPATQATSTYVIPAGVWTHVAVTSNGTQAVFYMNGVPQTIATAVTLGSSANEMRIGRGNADAGSGKLDEIRVWSTVRTPAEILANMCVKYIPPSTTGLKAIWHMDSTFVDSVNGWNGTAIGTVGFDTANNCMMTGIKNVGTEVPKDFLLYQNYPNPFNPTTTIKFSIIKSAYVELKVYDITGKEVSTLVSDPYLAGTYQVDFNASNLSSGIYFYRLVAGDFSMTKKMILIK